MDWSGPYAAPRRARPSGERCEALVNTGSGGEGSAEPAGAAAEVGVPPRRRVARPLRTTTRLDLSGSGPYILAENP